MKKPRSYVALSLLSSCALGYACTLSRPERTVLDWLVLALLLLAVLWNLVNLGRRLNRAGGGRALWHLQRTLLFWVIGVLNTGLIRPAEIGSWKHVVGWGFVALAALDTFQLHRVEQDASTQPDVAGRTGACDDRSSSNPGPGLG